MSRVVALSSDLPPSVIWLVLLVATVGMGLVGYGSGLGSQRSLIASVAMALLLALVVLIIVDLDRPRRGLVRVGQQSMTKLREGMKAGE